MIRRDSGKNKGISNELREKLIIPIVKNIVNDLEQAGWYCVVGDGVPYNVEESSRNADDKPYCFTSLQVVDIEHRLVQYVYVFFQSGNIRIVGDDNSKIRDITIELTESNEKLDGAVRKILDLGI